MSLNRRTRLRPTSVPRDLCGAKLNDSDDWICTLEAGHKTGCRFRPPTAAQVAYLQTRTRLNPVNRARQKKREEDQETYGPYHEHLRGRPCCVAVALGTARECYGPPKPHHAKTVKSGGKDEANELPMCAGHHSELETIGPSRWEAKYELRIETVKEREWRLYQEQAA